MHRLEGGSLDATVPTSSALRHERSSSLISGADAAPRSAGTRVQKIEALAEIRIAEPPYLAHASTKRSLAAKASDCASACLRQSAILATRPSTFSMRLSR